LIWNAVDSSGDNQVEYTEFLASCLSIPKTLMDNAANIVFNTIDKDGNGSIELKEFKKFMIDNKFPDEKLNN